MDPSDRAGLVAKHGPLVWGLCRRLCPEPEDAYQEVWEKVFGAVHRFDPDGTATLRTWISTIAHRHLVDRHRRRQVRGEVVELGEIPVAPDQDGLDLRRRTARLEAALQRLPEGQRRIVVLHHLEGVPLEQLAHDEEIAVGTVKSRLHRARARLLELMEGK